MTRIPSQQQFADRQPLWAWPRAAWGGPGTATGVTELGAPRAPHGRKQPACGPGEATASNGHRGHEQLQTAPGETPAEPRAREAARGPQASSPPCAPRQGGLTWHQDDRLPLPPVSIVANDVSLLRTAAEGRGSAAAAGATPSAQAPLTSYLCPLSPTPLCASTRACPQPDCCVPRAPAGPSSQAPEPHGQDRCPGLQGPNLRG